MVSSHPEQGWRLLCNGVVLFDDDGELLPDGSAVARPPHLARPGLIGGPTRPAPDARAARMDPPDSEAAQELGSIAHGPVLLDRGHGIAVGLRCVFAHRTGLHLPLVLIARDVHADAAARRLRGHG